MPRFRVLVPIVAVIAVAVGVGLVVFVQTSQASFGWFAYAPLSHQVFESTTVTVSSDPSVVVFGLAVLALVFRLGMAGRQRRSRPTVWIGRAVLTGAVVLGVVGMLVGQIPGSSYDIGFADGVGLTFGQAAALTDAGVGLVLAGLLVLAFWSGRRTARRGFDAEQAN